MNPTPSDSRVRIMNIVPKYEDGIELSPGEYHIRVDKSGYETEDQWVELKAGEKLDVAMVLSRKGASTVASSTSSSPFSSVGTPRSGDIWTEPVTGMEFVWVEGGCYMMGSNHGDSNEKPVHEVCVDGFWMGKYEVTIDEYRDFLQATDQTSDVDWDDDDCPVRKGGSYALSRNKFGRDGNQPMVEVSWHGAVAFAKWLSGETGKAIRLPSEAEWEYAARGGTRTMRFWGRDDSDACRYANVADKGHNWSPNFPCDDGYKYTAPVGYFQANAFGLYDMLGNVWEWCRDVYDNDAYSRHSRNNPVVTTGDSGRVYRGGGWCDDPGLVRAANRGWNDPDGTFDGLGFRLCFPRVR